MEDQNNTLMKSIQKPIFREITDPKNSINGMVVEGQIEFQKVYQKQNQ